MIALRLARWVGLSVASLVGMVLAALLVAVVVLVGMGQLPRALDRVVSLVDPVVFAPQVVSEVADPAVAQLVTSGGGMAGSCSGFFVAPEVVLTAAHCLFIGDPVDSVTVYPGAYRVGDRVVERFGSCEAISWDVPEGYVDEGLGDRFGLGDTSWDYAVVHVEGCHETKLDSMLGSRAHVDSFFLLGPPPGLPGLLPLHAATYPGNQPPRTLAVNTGGYVQCFECAGIGVSRTNLEVHPGSSGGVVWVEHGGRRHAVGIVSSTGERGTFVRDVDGSVRDFVAAHS